MRFASVMIVVFALVLAGVVYLVVPRLLNTGARQALLQQQQAAARRAASNVLVAAQNLPAGTVIKPEDLRWQGWPQDNLAPEFLVRDKGADAQKDAIGRIVLHGFEKDEPILPQRLLKPGEAGFLAAVLAPGKRAVSIRIDAVAGASGFILPDDHVDVLLNERYNVPSPPQVPGSEPLPQVNTKDLTSVIVRDVKVLAIDQVMQDIDSKPKLAATATVEVDLTQAEKLALAAQMGTMSLLLRSHTPASPPESEVGNAIVEDVQVSPFRAAFARGGAATPSPQPSDLDQQGAGLRVYHGTTGLSGTGR